MYITHCRDCVFAKFEDNKQVGCKYDRVRKFKELGLDVQEVTDSDITYNTINILCNHCFTKKAWDEAKNPETALFNFSCIKNTFVFIDDKEKDFATTYNNVLGACHSAVFSSVRPQAIIYVLLKPERFTASENLSLVELVKSILKNTGISYNISYPLETTNWNAYLYSAKNNLKTDYFSVFEGGYPVSMYFNEHLNNILNVDVKNFIVVSSNTNNGWVVNRKFLEIFGWDNPEFCGKSIITEIENSEYKSDLLTKLIIKGEEIDFYAKPTVGDYRNS